MRTRLFKALEEVGGEIKVDHLVSSSTPLFNIDNIIRMKFIAAKDNIKPNTDVKSLTGHSRRTQDIPFLVGDSYAPIFEEDNK